MGLKGGGALALPRMLKSEYIQEYLSFDLKNWLQQAEEGSLLKAKAPDTSHIFHTFRAELLIDLAEAFYQAKNDGKFTGPGWTQQLLLADRLHKITLSFSKLGINALIDEVTGYQHVRKDNALQQLMDLYVEDIFQPWQRRFPEAFYKEIYRLKNWHYDGTTKHPQMVSKITRQFVYDYLPKEVMQEVRNRREGDEKLHQWLTTDKGIRHLETQIAVATSLMRACLDWEEFTNLFSRSFNPDHTEQLKLF
ncbi:P63C domain-containing protein [Bacillus thuringiensis]|uniref:P63C domain-containing protein n=1 Tax=Bacillus thuringiensis TaxID=1428 RepID=UPI0020D26632|nr:P63C domain-containing protein [Bacillus thuringiensis]